MGTGGALTGAAGDPGFPDRMCGLKQHHINGIWECFYSAGVDDGIVDPALASDTGLVLGGEACIWGEGTSAFSLDTQAFTLPLPRSASGTGPRWRTRPPQRRRTFSRRQRAR
eukprot:COSAG04_NODE_2399_length_4206_cov_1.788410_4_plen_112_part_00